MINKTINKKIRELGIGYVAEQCVVSVAAVSLWVNRGISDVRIIQLKALWPDTFGKNKKAARKKVKVITWK